MGVLSKGPNNEEGERMWLCKKRQAKILSFAYFFLAPLTSAHHPDTSLAPFPLSFSSHFHLKNLAMDDLFDGAIGIDLGTTYS